MYSHGGRREFAFGNIWQDIWNCKQSVSSLPHGLHSFKLVVVAIAVEILFCFVFFPVPDLASLILLLPTLISP